jgi:hypothetical protein
MIAQITTIIASGLFFAAGGKNFLMARREFVPAFIAADCFYTTHSLWCLTQLSAILFLSLGYGVNSKFRHIFGDCWGRGFWGLLVAIALSLGLFLTGHMAWYWFMAYLLIGFFFEPLFKNLQQVFGDIIIGAGFSSIVFLIK